MKKSDKRRLYYAYKYYLIGGKGTLYQAYKTPSERKISAWIGILSESVNRDSVQIDATQLRVISRTRDFYSCGYISTRVDPVNGDVNDFFVYHTAYRKLEIPVQELLDFETEVINNH